MSRCFHIGRYVAYFERRLSLFQWQFEGSSNMEDLKGLSFSSRIWEQAWLKSWIEVLSLQNQQSLSVNPTKWKSDNICKSGLQNYYKQVGLPYSPQTPLTFFLCLSWRNFQQGRATRWFNSGRVCRLLRNWADWLPVLPRDIVLCCWITYNPQRASLHLGV